MNQNELAAVSAQVKYLLFAHKMMKISAFVCWAMTCVNHC